MPTATIESVSFPPPARGNAVAKPAAVDRVYVNGTEWSSSYRAFLEQHDEISPSSNGCSHCFRCSSVPNMCSTSMLPVSGAAQLIAWNGPLRSLASWIVRATMDLRYELDVATLLQSVGAPPRREVVAHLS